MSVHRPIARNFAATSENKIHSDVIAKRMGFTGALVPGVTVFAHLTWPLTDKFGARWLEDSFVTTRFIKPAYEGETLRIVDCVDGDKTLVECHNANDVLLATLDCKLGVQAPIDARAAITSKVAAERVNITWDDVHVDESFPTYTWTPSKEHNRDYAARVDDKTSVFQQGVVHPHAILSQANQALVKRFIMPAWIHTGSEIHFRKLLRVDDAVEVRAMAIEKWEKKGHQFIKLYIAFVVGDIVATEILHTAIFRIAEK